MDHLKGMDLPVVQFIILAKNDFSLGDHSSKTFSDVSLIPFLVAGLNEPLKSILYEYRVTLT